MAEKITGWGALLGLATHINNVIEWDKVAELSIRISAYVLGKDGKVDDLKVEVRLREEHVRSKKPEELAEWFLGKILSLSLVKDVEDIAITSIYIDSIKMVNGTWYPVFLSDKEQYAYVLLKSFYPEWLKAY